MYFFSFKINDFLSNKCRIYICEFLLTSNPYAFRIIYLYILHYSKNSLGNMEDYDLFKNKNKVFVKNQIALTKLSVYELFSN